MAEGDWQANDDVELLLRNARLRDELEPFYDDSIASLEQAALPTPVENEYLASMLAWERAPVLPIARWFEPPLVLPDPERLSDAELHRVLMDAIHRLYEQRVVLDFTDHLTDRQLYCLILRDILPSPEKKIDDSSAYLHWDCADVAGDAEVWLRFYATDEERATWAESTGEELPPRENPPFLRDLPHRPL